MSNTNTGDATVVRQLQEVLPVQARGQDDHVHRPVAEPQVVLTLAEAFPTIAEAVEYNPLLHCAACLLLLATQLRCCHVLPDVSRLRERIVRSINAFEEHAHALHLPEKMILAARYILATALDEAVLATVWGQESGWSQRTLLAMYHGETYGGAKVFALLKLLSSDPAKHLYVLELLHFTLAAGFCGRYLVEPGGLAILEDRKLALYRLIMQQRGVAKEELSPQWKPVQQPLLASYRRRLVSICVGIALVTLFLVYIGLYWQINQQYVPLQADLARFLREKIVLAPAPPRSLPTLQGILRSEQQAGVLTITVGKNHQSVIRIASATMFPSGSAEVAHNQYGLLRTIANELNRFPGRLLVVGHTDDQPVRGSRYKDNYELSMFRARNVGALLSETLTDPRRIQTQGVGDSQPLVQPGSSPAQRARNRRVEIIYLPEDSNAYNH